VDFKTDVKRRDTVVEGRNQIEHVIIELAVFVIDGRPGRALKDLGSVPAIKWFRVVLHRPLIGGLKEGAALN
jgi:hypothetical protein